MSAREALARLEGWPRRRLAHLPTPLLEARRLARASGTAEVELLVKMDAETGFGLGGNKVRKLELELAPDRLRGITCLVTAGGPQSNHCRVTAAAAARLGLECVLVLNGPEPTDPRGNALLHRLFGARILTVERREDRTPALEGVARQVEDEGGRALVVPIGASTGLGALGYARAAVELSAQMETRGDRPPRTWIFVPSSSCGTLAGLALGFALLGRDDVRLVGVSVDAPAGEIRSSVLRIAGEAAELLAWEGTVPSDLVTETDAYVGDGYGLETPESREVIRSFARLEGLVLDPVYTAKGAAGMMGWLREGRVSPSDSVVFLHTGGHPALLA